MKVYEPLFQSIETAVHTEFSWGTIKHGEISGTNGCSLTTARLCIRRDESVYAKDEIRDDDRQRMKRRCHKGRIGVAFAFRGREARAEVLRSRYYSACIIPTYKLFAKPRDLCISDCCALYFPPPAPEQAQAAHLAAARVCESPL